MDQADKPLEHLVARIRRLMALADAYEPGAYALADGVCHVYWDVPECCQTLRDDIRWALECSRSLADVTEVLKHYRGTLLAEKAHTPGWVEPTSERAREMMAEVFGENWETQ